MDMEGCGKAFSTQRKKMDCMKGYTYNKEVINEVTGNRDEWKSLLHRHQIMR